MPTIYCVGRNYAAHVREMEGAGPGDAEPVVFLKPESALLAPPGPIRFPPAAGVVHHETEIVVRVGPDKTAEAVAVGLDLTDRTRQAEAKQHGWPWAAPKGFAGSAPVGPFVSASDVGPLDRLRFTLKANGAVAQRGDTSLMLRPIPALLASLDDWFELRPGDLVFTGTPEGVGPLTSGDVLELALEGFPAASAHFDVA